MMSAREGYSLRKCHLVTDSFSVDNATYCTFSNETKLKLLY